MRDKTIKDKLEYVSEQIQLLWNAVHDSKMKNQDPKNISHLVGDILSNLTETFDYCAQDIFEFFCAQSFKGKKPEIKFPFYVKQLTKTDNPFFSLSSCCPTLYSYLIGLAQDADNNVDLKNTIISSSLPRKIRKLVNDKKHSDIIKIDNNGVEELTGEMEGMQFTIPVHQGCFSLGEPITTGDVKLVKTRSYQLKDVNEEIFEFCLKAKASTELIINEIYKYLK